uniref:Protochlorophyllide reductase n=2 Tax=Alexandrium monilatum TaxID=311494 RepID=A0A7S4Q151_9DINO
MPDSDEKRQLAARQRDQGLLSPGDPDYDKKMSELWGGPPPSWYDQALEDFAARYSYPASGRGKLALVTGGGGGIGFYVVKGLARLGFDVLVPARPGMEGDAQAAAEAAKGVAAPGVKVSVPAATLDLGSFESVRSFGATMREALPSLDLLCLNAGRGGGRDDRREVTGDGHEAVMQVNALSHFLLACELMPLLRRSAAGRIASQSSGARYQAKLAKVDDIDGTDASKFSAWDQYCLSKASNVLFTLALNDRLAAAGVANVIATASDPGLTATGVNIQHDLVKSLGIDNKLQDTNRLHDVAGHHAADGSLALLMASVDTGAGRSDFYVAGKAKSFAEAVYKLDPYAQPAESKATDPLCESSWPRRARESFWGQALRMTGANWEASLSKL